MNLRVEAENIYAQYLYRISQRGGEETAIQVGMLGREVQCFKEDCQAKARAAEELAENVAQDCVAGLQRLIDDQEREFQKILAEGKEHVQNITEMNANVRKLAQRYYEASENAEKFLTHYQELKLNTEIPYPKRKSLHESVHSTINIARDGQRQYENVLPEANDYVKGFLQKTCMYRDHLISFEEARCEQIHSSINQFVVFEKFAEMNNKYDVNNFSKLIDDFDLKKEVQTIQEGIEEQIKHVRVTQSEERTNQTIFDPVIPLGAGSRDYRADAVLDARYEFAKYKGRRYDLHNLTEQLLASPPNRIIQYTYKEEVINYILDKAFVELPLKVEHVEAIE